jgi:hypothetical protein
MTCGYENPTFQVGCRHPKKRHFGIHPTKNEQNKFGKTKFIATSKAKSIGKTNSPAVVENSPDVVGNSPDVVGNSPDVVENSPNVVGNSPDVVGKPSICANHDNLRHLRAKLLRAKLPTKPAKSASTVR